MYVYVYVHHIAYLSGHIILKLYQHITIDIFLPANLTYLIRYQYVLYIYVHISTSIYLTCNSTFIFISPFIIRLLHSLNCVYAEVVAWSFASVPIDPQCSFVFKTFLFVCFPKHMLKCGAKTNQKRLLGLRLRTRTNTRIHKAHTYKHILQDFTHISINIADMI